MQNIIINKLELVSWIKNNIFTKNDKLYSKKCMKSYYDTYNISYIYNSILQLTGYLSDDVSFPQRIWHVINGIDNIVKCKECNSSATFISFVDGYRLYCSSKCSTNSKDVQNKIINSNLKKYGTEWGFQNEDIKKKCIKSVVDKFGVDNISKVKEVQIKKGIKISECRKEKYILKLLKTKYFRDMVEFVDVNGYNGVHSEYEFKCKICNNIFMSNLVHNFPICRICNPMNSISMAERQVSLFIKENYDGRIIENDRKILNGKEIDVFLPDLNLGFEYDGLLFHSEHFGELNKNYHLNKTELAKSKGIKLIHIFEDEWSHKNSIIKNKILYLLGKKKETYIHARKCDIRLISKDIKRDFLNAYHIQGDDKSKLCFGAYYNDKLVSIVTFGNPRISLGNKTIDNKEFELVRFCSNKIIPGILSRFIKKFKSEYDVDKIITYADYRIGDGLVYIKNGFSFIGKTTPNYWYIQKNKNNRIHRFAYRKSIQSKKLKDFDSNITEWQNMINNGFDRIWDCGSLKYEYNFKLN